MLARSPMPSGDSAFCGIMRSQLECTLFLREKAPMPITRRRRANPPDQPENNNHLADQSESNPETLVPEQEPPILSMDGEQAGMPLNERMGNADISSVSPSHLPVSNGDRLERQDYTSPIE